jgi:hypothetical protein
MILTLRKEMTMRYVTLFVTTVAVLFVATSEASAGIPPQNDFIDSLIEFWDLMAQMFGS